MNTWIAGKDLMKLHYLPYSNLNMKDIAGVDYEHVKKSMERL